MLSSLQNPLIKTARGLSKRKNRELSGQFLLEGPKALEEVLRANCPPGILFHLESTDQEVLRPFVEWQKICVHEKILASLSDTSTSQGLVGLLQQPKADLEPVLMSGGNFWLIIDGVQDPGNLGTMLRTAVAAGADGVILTKGTVDPFNPKAARASAGALYRVPLILNVDQMILAQMCGKVGIKLLAASPRGQQKHYEVDLCQNIAIAVGSEGQGLSKVLLQEADLVHIPQVPGLDSLNVAVATGILLYEGVRQRQEH